MEYKTYRQLIQEEARKRHPILPLEGSPHVWDVNQYASHQQDSFKTGCFWLLKELDISPDSKPSQVKNK